MGEVIGWEYELISGVDADVLRSAVWSLMQAPTIEITRKSKAGMITLDVRPMIRSMRVREDGVVEASLGVHEGRPGKARELVKLLGLPTSTRVVRTEIWVGAGEDRVSPGLGWSAASPGEKNLGAGA